MGGDVSRFNFRIGQRSFNPRLRVGGDLGGLELLVHVIKFQSTPPRGRRPSRPPDNYKRSDVSIHASAWEATARQALMNMGGSDVSIHASAWEATASSPTGGDKHSFQSTPPRGRRQDRRPHGTGDRRVSIHASAWEATFSPALAVMFRQVSIHASAWEATRLCSRTKAASKVSIHASAWEATQLSEQPPRGHQVSIHASAWEATEAAGLPD